MEIRTPSSGPPDRILAISGLAVGVAVLAALAAQVLTRLIGFITNLAFYSKFSTSFSSPADNHLGLGVIFVPVIGALIVGLMARFGSSAIRGHGIPEAMEQVLLNESRIPPRITFLKPVSAAVAIGTGGPLASAVFAFEATRQPNGLLPVLAGCATAYLVSLRLMPHSIMTEKLARRGTRIRSEMHADLLDRILVSSIASKSPVTLRASESVEEVRDWMVGRAPGSSHQGFAVLDDEGDIVGVVTRRDLLDLELPLTAVVSDLIRRLPVVIYDDNSAREAADHMLREDVGRLPVVSRAAPRTVIGVLSRSDVLGASQEQRQRRRSQSETRRETVG